MGYLSRDVDFHIRPGGMCVCVYTCMYILLREISRVSLIFYIFYKYNILSPRLVYVSTEMEEPHYLIERLLVEREVLINLLTYTMERFF